MVKRFLQDVNTLFAVPAPKKFKNLLLEDYPFDLQLLNLSSVYRISRQLYLKNGGTFSPRLSSAMRSLSAHDLFSDVIEFTPGLPELIWIRDFGHSVSDAKEEIAAFLRFNEISLFHEQNHRILWRLLPPPPRDQYEFFRYLNFAESIVVVLDLAMADQLGKSISGTFERLKMIYRPGSEDNYKGKSRSEYRQYLLALLVSTYYLLEGMDHRDILKAVNYVLPEQKQLNRPAAKRSLELSELFTDVTNPGWQRLYWKAGMRKLNRLHRSSDVPALRLPPDPLDLDRELSTAARLLEAFGL